MGFATLGIYATNYIRANSPGQAPKGNAAQIENRAQCLSSELHGGGEIPGKGGTKCLPKAFEKAQYAVRIFRTKQDMQNETQDLQLSFVHMDDKIINTVNEIARILLS